MESTQHTMRLFAEGGPLARRLGGAFEHRPQQLAMASAVERCMAGTGRLLVEAGTGVGKSLAYLVPAVERIVRHGERVVICTNTIALQEQLVSKDIPLLQAVLPEEFSTVLVKGRGNYVSIRRLRRAVQGQHRLFSDEGQRSALLSLDEWIEHTSDGSSSSLPGPLPAGVWEQVQSDQGNCMGRRCPTYEQCFFQRARRRMESGQLLVCNHALFFSDLALRASSGRGILPPYHHVVLDEGHGIEEVVSGNFGGSLSEDSVLGLLGTLWGKSGSGGVLGHVRLVDAGDELLRSAVGKVEAVRRAAQEFFGLWWRWRQAQSGEGDCRIRCGGQVHDGLSGPLADLAVTVALVRERCADASDAQELDGLSQRAESMARACSALVAQSLPGCVYWLSSSSRARRGRGQRPHVTLSAAVIDVGPVLQQHLFGQEISVAITSGTLATARGDCTATARALGVPDPTVLALGSPFDYARQVELFLEPQVPDPRDAGHLDVLAHRVLAHVAATDGGAFVLCTSFRTLGELVERTAPWLEEHRHPVLAQGSGPSPAQLLASFRADGRSVLFGVASFWQGIDVRGDALRNVIITRLPFEVPDAPLVQARGEAIRQRGGNAFAEDALPRAILRFRQGFGRLIRSAEDRGRVVVLDSRIVTKGYGSQFIQALPQGIPVTTLDIDGSPLARGVVGADGVEY